MKPIDRICPSIGTFLTALVSACDALIVPMSDCAMTTTTKNAEAE